MNKEEQIKEYFLTNEEREALADKELDDYWVKEKKKMQGIFEEEKEEE